MREGQAVARLDRPTDPRRCPASTAAVLTVTDLDRSTVLCAFEIAALTLPRSTPVVVTPEPSPDVSAPPGVVHEGVTRGEQNPDKGVSPSVDEGLDLALDAILKTNLPDPRKSFPKTEACRCGAERYEYDCELCSGASGLSSFMRAALRWTDMGEPDADQYRARYGCSCTCHVQAPQPAVVREVNPLDQDHAERAEAAAVFLKAQASQGPCVRCFETDSLRCMNKRTRRALSGLNAKVVAGDLWRGRGRTPGLLPELEAPAAPEGPALFGRVTFCTCPCHEAGRGRWTRTLKRRRRTGATRRAILLPSRQLLRCACPSPGAGERRPKQQARAIERKKRVTCAKAMPKPPAIPAPCACTCHVEGCCRRRREDGSDGERSNHAEAAQVSLFGICGCTEHEAGACSSASRGPRILAAKVDTLHLSYHADLNAEWMGRLEAKRQEAENDRKAVVTIRIPGLEDLCFRVTSKGGGSIYRYRLTNEFCDLMVSRSKAANAAQLRFELRSAFLWEKELEGAWGWCRDVAVALHTGPRCVRSTVTRLDLAVDTMGIDFRDVDRRDFVKRARRLTRYSSGTVLAGEPCPACTGTGACRCCEGAGLLSGDSPGIGATLEEHLSGLTDSGLSFGSSGIVCRIYDKTREIREKSKDKKWLWAVWGAHGWTANDTVWRVEVQVRTEALAELVGEKTLVGQLGVTARKKPRDREGVKPIKRAALGLNELEGCRQAVASVWGYCLGGARGHTAWLKWCVPSKEDTRRSRWDARPEWKVIQRADWRRAEPFEIVREKKRAATFNMLLPQHVGLTKAMAALAGKKRVTSEMFDEAVAWEEPTAGDFERHAERYVVRKHGDRTKGFKEVWAELVNESRVEREQRAAEIETGDEAFAREMVDHERRKEKRARLVTVDISG